MEKLIYLMGDAEAGRPPKGRDDLLARIREAIPDLRAAGGHTIACTVVNEREAKARSMTPDA